MLEELTKLTFEPHLQESFRICPSDGKPIEAKLIELKTIGTEMEDTGNLRQRTPFSVLFCGPETPILPQNIYRIEHDQLDTMELFLVPVGPGKAGMLYEAVFT